MILAHVVLVSELYLADLTYMQYYLVILISAIINAYRLILSLLCMLKINLL